MSATELATISVPGVELTPTGITIPKDITTADYHRVGAAIGRLHGMTAWAVGDWVNANPDAQPTDVIAQHIADTVGLTKGTVAEYGRVARRFPPERRRNVAWGMHQALAAQFPETADRILVQAEQEGWSVAAVRLRVADANGGETTGRAAPGTATVLPAVGSAKSMTVTVEWSPEVADDPDLVRTLNTEMRRMISEWEFVKNVKVEPAKT